MLRHLRRKTVTSLIVILAAVAAAALAQTPVGTAITYQGRLLDGGAPANGSFDFQFSLWDAATGGMQVGTTQSASKQTIADGLVQATLNFGDAAFDGGARWLEVTVRASGGGSFTPLAPRQRVTPAPQSQYALVSGAAYTLDAADGDPAGAVFVDGEGRVGIGTASPVANLHIEGARPSETLFAVLDEAVDDAQGGPYDGLESAWNLVVVGDLAYVTSQVDDSMTIFDLSDPANIATVGSIADDSSGGTATFMNNSQGIAVAGSVAYVCSLTEDTVTAIDVSNPAAPTQLGFIRDNSQGGTATALNGSLDLFAVDATVYVVAQADHALSILDFSTPATPFEAGAAVDDGVGGGTIDGMNTPRSVWVSGTVALVVSTGDDALVTLDVSNPSSIAQLGKLQDISLGGTATNFLDPTDIHVVGNRAYVACQASDALTIVDFSDPANPVQVGVIVDSESGGTAEALDGARAVFVRGSRAYVAGGIDNSMSVIDVLDPTNPFEVGAVTDDIFGGEAINLAAPIDVAVSGGLAVVITNVDDSLVTIDVGFGDLSLLVFGDAVKDTGPMWSMFSDARLKTAIAPLTGGLEHILRLRPVEYEYAAAWERAFGRPAPAGRQAGFLAQEFGTVFPDDVRRDARSGYLAIDPSRTVPEMVAAIQALNARLEEADRSRDAEIRALQARIEALETTRDGVDPQ